MNNFLPLLPFLISAAIGFLLIGLIFHKEEKPPLILHFILGTGLGLGISSFLTFLSFIIYNHLNSLFVLIYHILLLIGLLIINLFYLPRDKKSVPWRISFDLWDALFLVILAAAFWPLWLQAAYYEWGGWDAWQVWNFKARMLFLGGEHWRNMFEPFLWRSSPHYPLFLPLINVWGWTFTGTPVNIIPMLTGFIFSTATLMLLAFALKDLTKSFWVILAPCLLVTLTLFNQLAASQYSDIVVAFYLLAAIYGIIKGTNNSPAYMLLAGLMAGCLVFTKSEGLVAGGLLVILGLPYILLQKIDGKIKLIIWLLIGTVLAALPAVYFYKVYGTKNITFINGFTSAIKPTTLERLKVILGYTFFQLISPKWHGLWILLFAGVILNLKKCFRRALLFCPLFLIAYAGITAAYYLTNTYFEITWWLTVTMERLLFAVLPTIIFWVFAGAFSHRD